MRRTTAVLIAIVSSLVIAGCAPNMARDTQADARFDSFNDRHLYHPLIRHGLTSRNLNLGT